MKKLVLSLALAIAGSSSFATVHFVGTGASSFSPANVTAAVGDTVAFVITGVHTATEVSQSTWNANGTTPLSGGFNFNSSHTTAGTSFIVITNTSTRYFVCQAHAAMGMKGTINSTASANDLTKTQLSFNVYPNPTAGNLNISINSEESGMVQLEVVNLLGAVAKDLGDYEVGGGQTIVKADVSALPRGVYFVRVVTDNRQNKMVKFLKD